MARLKRKRWGHFEGGLIDDGAFHPVFSGDDYYYATLPKWQVKVDGKNVQLAILFSIMDTRDFDEDADERYPFVFEPVILVAYPGPEFLEKAQEAGEETGHPRERLYAAERYSGGVPVGDILLEMTADDPAIEGVSARRMQWVAKKQDAGTVAARKGQGVVFEYPQFRDAKSALEFANILLKAAPALFEDIERVLSLPINMAGEEGWETIVDQAQ